MRKSILPANGSEPTPRVYSMSVIIKSFKGRKNVQAHLFRYGISSDELKNMETEGCIETDRSKYSHLPHLNGSLEDTKHMVLENFTAQERDHIIKYLEKRYASRLEAIEAGPVIFPIPQGTMPLCSIPEGKSMGFIKFESVPDYPLPFNFRGFYDLDQHEPLIS